MKTLVPTLLVLALLGVAALVVWSGLAQLSEPVSMRRPDLATERVGVGEGPEPRPSLAGEESEPGAETPSWITINERGLTALEEGDHQRAIELFERCREGVPEEDTYARNLAEALARKATALWEGNTEGARAEALALLERAVELAPEREGLGELLERRRTSAQAEEGFFRQLTEHFELSYDLNRPELRREIDALGRLLEAAYLEFGESFGFWPVERGRPAIRVVLYTRADFDAVTGIGDWAGGVYDGTIRVPVADLAREMPRLARVLRHELLHAYVQEAGGSDVPGWLNEGLAQWLEEVGADERAQAAQHARGKLQGGKLFPLAELQGSLASWTDKQAIGRAYAQAQALVAYVAQIYGEDELFEMVTGCRTGASASQTFARRVGIPLGTVMEDLEAEIHGPR